MTKFVLILLAPLYLRASSVGVPSPSMYFIYMRYAQPCCNSGKSVILLVTKGHNAKYFLGSWSLGEERTSVPCSLCLSHQEVLDSLASSSISYLTFSLQPLQCRVWRWEAYFKHRPPCICTKFLFGLLFILLFCLVSFYYSKSHF